MMSETAVMSSVGSKSGFPPSPGPKPPSRGTPLSFERPSTRSRAVTPKTPSGERLTPMPSYMRPILRSAQHKWGKLHEDHMMNKLLEKRDDRKSLNQVTRQEAMKVARKIPMEILAQNWMKDNRTTIESRAFLVDKVLPTLILGVEKMLTEVDRLGISESEPDRNFNPINFLAQYLMRNNPRYSNFSEASPYIRGLREVGEELRKQLFDIEENKLAHIKAEARRQREEREHAEHMRLMEQQRRADALRRQFHEWNIGYFHDARIELALIQNALRSFVEVTEHYPDDVRRTAQFSLPLETTDDTGKTLGLREFVAYLTGYIKEMPAPVFDHFMTHLSHCALSYRIQAERKQRHGLLTNLFVSCDHTGVGLLDRHRILNLFEMYWDRARETIRQTLRNPRKWPVVDVGQMDIDTLSDSDEDAQDTGSESKAAEDAAGAEGKVEKAASAQVSQDGEQVASAGQHTTTGETDVEEKSDEPESQQEMTDAEGMPPPPDGAIPPPPDGVSEQEEAADGSTVEKPVEKEGTDDAVDDTADGEEKGDPEKEAEDGGENVTEDAATDAVADKAVEDTSETEKEKATSGVPEKDEDEQAMSQAAGTSVEDGELSPTDSQPTTNEPELAQLSDRDDGVPPATADAPPRTQQSKVSFAEGTTFNRERTVLQSSRGSRSHSVASAYDESTLNLSQFVNISETFLGDTPAPEAFNQLINFIREGYMETEDERMQRLIKARQEAQIQKRKALLNSLFEMWDNDSSGSLDLEEVSAVMLKYKDGIETEAVNLSKKEFKKKSKANDTRLTKREFRDFVHKVVENMVTADVFDYFIEYLLNSVERSYAERVRGEARKKWLQLIVNAGETSGVNMEPVYKSVFQSLYKDAEAHGNSKQISAYIAMLEANEIAPARGDNLLRYVAATPDTAPFVLGKALFKDMRGISFASVDTGKPIHVPRVGNHGSIHFWNTDRPDDEREGSFIVVPLRDRRKRVFGLLGIDTLNDPHSRAIFITHEIQFFQGVAKAFSIAYHNVDVRQKTIRISESAVSWIHRRSPNVHEITVYMVEPDGKGRDYILRKMMITDHKGAPNILKKPPRLERRDNLFRDYLFKCVDNSESITADAYGERHLAIPLRDDEGLAIVVIDISIGELKQLPRNENREVMKMLKLLQVAYKEIARESRDGDSSMLEGESSNDSMKADILFDRLMLLELRDNVHKLDMKAYAELKSYVEPPHIIHQIIRSVLAIFYPQKAVDGEFNSWASCKQYVTPQLSQRIVSYDPTADAVGAENIPVELIHSYLEDVPHGQVMRHGSLPAQFLYNWVFVCESLIEHARKMHRTKLQNLADQQPLAGNADKKKASADSDDDDGTLRPLSPSDTHVS